MPTLLTPQSPDPASPPPPARTPVPLRSARYTDLEPHELLHLLDEVNDERARARFREAIYISVIVWLAIGWFLFYGPQVLFHQGRLINPADVLKQRDRELTYLDLPPDVAKQLPHKPTTTLSDRNRTEQTAHPTLDRKTLQQLQAMRRAGAPGAATPQPPAAPQPQPSAAQPTQQQPPPQPQPAQQPPVLDRPRPQPTQQPTQQASVDAPHPQPTRPNFSQPTQSAGTAIQQAARAAAQQPGFGQGGNYGSGVPVEHQGLNTGVDVLSDTMGVDFNPYLRRILREIYNTWIPLIPEEARPPLNKSGTTLVRFTILPDGHIGAMRLEDSSHDDAINRAAWGSITGVGQFPPLPREFHGPNLELRIHYLVNKEPTAR